MLRFFSRRHRRNRGTPRRHFRPRFECLESRELLAFNLLLSSNDTVGVTKTTASGTTSYIATANGANVSLDDVGVDLAAGRNVIIHSGSTGTQPGNIVFTGVSSNIVTQLGNAAGTTLSILTGTGSGLVGNVALMGLKLKNPGNIIVLANNDVTETGAGLFADTISISSQNGSISSTAGGTFGATSLSLTAYDGIGSLVQPMLVSTDSLTADTSGGNGSQVITETDGLTGLNLNAGTGLVVLSLTKGGISDPDTATDIKASVTSIVLNDSTPQNVGAVTTPINTDVDQVTVDTSAGGGQQFVRETNGLTALNLNAGAGIIQLTVSSGGITDDDTAIDLAAAGATITLVNNSAVDIGSAVHPIATTVEELIAHTTAGNGNQFFVESDGLIILDLLAGAGKVSLTLTAGAVFDSDSTVDVVATSATILLKDSKKSDFGSSGHTIQTAVDQLTVDTSAGNGDQFLVESNGLSALNLKAHTARSASGMLPAAAS
jgi:hypothetical protein